MIGVIVTGPDITNGITDGNHLFLYGIRTDPNEKQNTAADHRDVVQKLAGKLVDFRNLQLPNAIAPYRAKVEGFVPPKEWRIDKP